MPDDKAAPPARRPDEVRALVSFPSLGPEPIGAYQVLDIDDAMQAPRIALDEPRAVAKLKQSYTCMLLEVHQYPTGLTETTLLYMLQNISTKHPHRAEVVVPYDYTALISKPEKDGVHDVAALLFKQPQRIMKLPRPPSRHPFPAMEFTVEHGLGDKAIAGTYFHIQEESCSPGMMLMEILTGGAFSFFPPPGYIGPPSGFF